MATPNRLVVVHNGHRLFDQTGVIVELVEQDDGETLKVFVSDLPEKEKTKAGEKHRRNFSQSLQWRFC